MINYANMAGQNLTRLRTARPVVHNITNFVVMNSTANALLAMGASPIMAHAPEELEEIIAIANAVVINIGTLSRPWIDSMSSAVRACAYAQKPFVLDPVGAGATQLRTETAKTLIDEATPAVIRGNASEILALSPQGGTTRGVDSLHTMEDAADAAREIARSLGTVIAVTGEKDLVTDGERTLVVMGGHPLLGYVTGTGCAASVTVAAFVSQEEDRVVAAASALAFFGLAGEKAAAEVAAPGTFWIKVLDALYTITPDELASKARIAAL
ncbi:MAG: hydroxyethylthiazole kinase [Thermodesulfobacteriota bacterium]